MFTFEELQKLETDKLRKEIRVAQKDLFKVKFGVKSGQLKANHPIKQNKKYIAQMRTILTKKQCDQKQD